MSRTQANEATLDLVWSLWTELGVPGPRRSHQRAAVDPERLLVATPAIATADPRLEDLVFSWCAQHAHRLSASRLATLLRAAAPDERVAAERFLGELAGEGVVLAKVAPVPLARPRARRTLAVPVERPALLRLRVRGLVGVGGRSDLLFALLSAPEQWLSASQLDDVGIAKRNIARILAELAEAGVVHDRSRGNVREFRLANPQALGEVVARGDVVVPDWRAVFAWMRVTTELASLSADRPATLLVEVARRRKEVMALAVALGVALPRADELAEPETFVAWMVTVAQSLADGASPS